MPVELNSASYDLDILIQADEIKSDSKRMANIEKHLDNRKADFDKVRPVKPPVNGFTVV